MGRARARMELIRRKKPRRMTFEKRGASLKKKAYELSTLCDVEVCLIVSFPRESDGVMETEIWPENTLEVHRLIGSFKNLRADDSRCKITDSCFFLKDRTKRIDADLAKLRRKALEAKFPTWEKMFDNFSGEELRNLDEHLKAKLEATRNRVDFIKTAGFTMMNSSSGDYGQFQQQHQNHPSYLVQNLNFSDRTMNTMEWDFLQQQPSCSYNSNVPSTSTQTPFSFVPLMNPPAQMYWLEQQHAGPITFPPADNAVTYDYSPAQFVADSFQHSGTVAAAAGDNGVQTGRYNYAPAMQQALLQMQPGPMNAPTTNQCFEDEHFQFYNS